MQQNFRWNIQPAFKLLSKIKKCIQGSVHTAPNAHTAPYAHTAPCAAHTLPQMHPTKKTKFNRKWKSG